MELPNPCLCGCMSCSQRVALPRRIARLYPAYGLYLYGEGLYAQETRALKLTGAPVLFLPGNAGSYKQARSLGSVALRKAENMEGGLHFNVFTVDFNEELVALYGGSLLRQTHFLHESIKAILRLYKHLKTPPQSVVLVGHSMGGVVARALFTLPRFNTKMVSLIITQASPHLAPVLALDPYLLDFYSAVRQKWVNQANKLRDITVLSVGGGYRDYQVRSGLTSLPCPPGDPNKLSLVATAVPRTWVSTDHLSIVWCKELVLATVRAFFDLIDPETRQFTENSEKKMAVLNHHFIRHPVRILGENQDTSISILDFPEAWSEVNTLRLTYGTPKEGQEMTSWVYGCVHKSGPSCVRAVDLSMGTELLPPYKVLILSLSELSSVTHLVVSASNLNGRQFTVECASGRDKNLRLCLSQCHMSCPSVSIRTSLPRVLGQILSYPPSTDESRRATGMSQVVGKGLQPHKVNLPVYILHVLLSCSWFQEVWSTLCFPSMDALPPTFPDVTFHEGVVPVEEWPHLLSPLLYILGAAVAYWGSTLLCLIIRLISLILAPLHRPSVSRDCGTLRLRTQILIALCLTVIGGTSCGALSIFAAFLLHLYRVLRLQMTERSLSHMLNLAPRKHKEVENGTVDAECLNRSKECNGTPLLSECALQEVRDDLQLHLCLSALFTLPVMLSAPSLIHWIRNLRYSTQLDPDPCWPHIVPLLIVYMLLINCNTLKLCNSKLLPLTSCLPLPLAITMVTFSPLHLYRVTYFLLASLIPLALCCLL
ncbi:GPI inositol-deacylase [Lates japonicus]|uniref:GPI inositol-deacylase n=1 Tax=Lates japonicus TaxID=270547 RepID=A0AAD3NII3_LATJO|nr:GPI inositol-deacylase [Lates japonicus]